MRIAYLNADHGIPVLGDKGASVHVREFVTALRDAGHDVVVLCAQLGRGNRPPPATLVELEPQPDEARLKAVAARFPGSRDLEDRLFRREIFKLAYDECLPERAMTYFRRVDWYPDVLYERYALFHQSGVELARGLRIPHLLEVNAPLAAEQERFRGLRLKDHALSMETAVWRCADHVLAVSDEVAQHVRARGVPAERISVVPNGVDGRRFHPEVDGTGIRRAHGLVGRKVIGFVGSFKPWHGVDFLLDVLQAVHQRGVDASLLAVGDGPCLEDVRQQAFRQGLEDKVIFAGRVSHEGIPAYLAAMDLTVAPYSPSTDFYFSPLKVVESLAMGKPVVAPAIGQLVSLLAHGEAGVLFPPGDAGACAEAVAEVLSAPERLAKLGRRGVELATRDFQWQKNVRRVADICAQWRLGGDAA